MPKKLAYLGPPGTFSEEAALLYDRTAELLPMASFRAVASAVEAGMADEGIVAIENSIEGSVTDVLDLLIHDSHLSIYTEVVLPINNQLLVKPGTGTGDIQVLYSHPQPLGQCRRFLQRCFPKAQLMASLSTTAAVQDMLQSKAPAAAIATRRAADLYKVEVLAKNIQDVATNVTRFVVLAFHDHPPTSADKTSLCFWFAEDKPGVLHSVLGEFATRNINLVKIESRPSKESLGKYVFLVDFEGHRLDAKCAEALSAVQAQTAQLKVFGSYPKFKGGASK